jgi:hypothetical protein
MNMIRGGVDGQGVDVSQVRRQGIGGDEQSEGKQNTQCFHDDTVVFSKFYEIGRAPFLVSVFGLQEGGGNCVVRIACYVVGRGTRALSGEEIGF